MVADKLLFIKSFSSVSASLLSVAAVATPTAVSLVKSKQSKKKSNSSTSKRQFDSTAEDGLDYNVTNGLNPFEFYSSTDTMYNIDNNFYTRMNQKSHDTYHSLDWNDLNPRSQHGLGSWLSQMTNYLADDKNYQIQVTNQSLSDNDNVFDYDFSSQQSSSMTVKWRTKQFGLSLKDNEEQFAMWKNQAYCCFPQLYMNNPTTKTKQMIFSSLTGSDFYTNYVEENDPSTIHSPHNFNFALKGKIDSQEIDTRSSKQEGEKTVKDIPVSGNINYITFTSEYTPLEELEEEDEWTSLGGFLKASSKNDQSTADKIILPLNPDTFHYFVFDSSEPSSGTYFLRAPELFTELYKEFFNLNSGETEDEFLTSLGEIENLTLSNDDNSFTKFVPYVNSTAKNAKDMDEHELVLPSEQTISIDSSTSQEGYVNFLDYYNTTGSSGLNCDISIDRNNQITYEFKNGSTVVSTKKATISPSFQEFLNMSLSAVASKSEYETATYKCPEEKCTCKQTCSSGDPVPSCPEGHGEMIPYPYENDSYCQVQSSGNNNIINLKTNLAADSSLSSALPFDQKYTSESQGNTLKAKSVGLGLSYSNPKRQYINTSGLANSNWYTNFAMMANETDLISDSNGNNNKMLTNLDYLLAVDPSSTNFYETQDCSKPIKIRLNPYYIQAAANAYSAYNFWLKFNKEHDKSNEYPWTCILNSGSVAPTKAMFRDLIMRGFIKTKVQAETIFKNLKGKRIVSLIPNNWYDTYRMVKNPVQIGSYAQFNSQNNFVGNSDFHWAESSFTPASTGIWVDENGNPYTSGGKEILPTVTQSTWAPFCWRYGIGPMTFAFLKSIPQDYTFTIPYAFINPKQSWNSGNISAVKNNIQEAQITWIELLQGNSIEIKPNIEDFKDYDEQTQQTKDWNNLSLVIGCNSSSILSKQGIHSTNKNPKTVINSSNQLVQLNLPDFGNIKLATIANSKNHIENNTDDFDMIPIQKYSSKAKRKELLKTRSDINYIPQNAAHNILAVEREEETSDISSTNCFSNNTYVVTKANSSHINNEFLEDMFVTIDTDGSLGIIANYSNFRDSINSICVPKKYYYSTENLITGSADEKSSSWIMEGVAPEDWFDSKYLVTYNDYTTYSWAFHPSGLWAYNMQFHQDINLGWESITGDENWDSLSKEYGLDYTLYGKPTIVPITKNTYVPQSIKLDWAKKYYDIYGTTPVLYTNNATHELAFKVVYNDLTITHSKYPGKTITPVQYVYFHDCFYKFNMTSINPAERSINEFPKTNLQYGDFSPSVFDKWTVDRTTSDQSKTVFSTYNALDLLSPGEIINFYQSQYTNGSYKCNMKYSEFMSLLRNGWIYINPVSVSNEGHSFAFNVYYYKDIQVDTQRAKFTTEKNKNYIMKEYGNSVIKVPETDSTNWIEMPNISINDFRCVGTEWSTVSTGSSLSPMIIGLIVGCCVIPILIAVTGIIFHRIRTKYKRIK